MRPELIAPDWPAVPGVRAFVTTRLLGDAKDENVRAAMSRDLPAAPAWLRQVHGTTVVDAAAVPAGVVPEADASYTDRPGVVCAVMTADCMPVALCARDGSVVGVAHAGWRGLCAGVIERTVEKMGVAGSGLQAWLGPAIGPDVYEIGAEVRDAFLARDARASDAFVPTRAGHWRVDLYAIARQRLAGVGITAVSGGDRCTASEPSLFYSYRDRKDAARMATCIWRV